MESNLEDMAAYLRGCYFGQELTVRTYHSGIVRKRILPVLLHSPAPTSHDLEVRQSHSRFTSSLKLGLGKAVHSHRHVGRMRFVNRCCQHSYFSFAVSLGG
ncbi:hypothetical protein BJY52DRAFT_1276073 [Lactarius psammicola]|nr:hypothetical protein BJY52DRAFT_1276073 [Lactarius psammicola]